MNDFEAMLQRQQDIEEGIFNNEYDIIRSNPDSIRQTADKSASMGDFIAMVDKLVTIVMPNVDFIPEEGKVLSMDAMKDFDRPKISYKVKSRKPKNELKPRVRQSVEPNGKNGEDRLGVVCGQKFSCTIQFNVFASVYKEAEAVMEEFEELIFSYTGFFKKNGVAELLFKEQVTDNFYERLRETLSVRNLIYYVEIEKLTVIFKEKIKEIELLAQKKEE